MTVTGTPHPRPVIKSSTYDPEHLPADFIGYVKRLQAHAGHEPHAYRLARALQLRVRVGLHNYCLPEAHPDPQRRYTAAVSCGALYVVIGLFGAVITGLLTAFPKELVVAIAGLALLGTIGSGLASALKEETHREAALITFLVTLSGVTVAGVGSAFWGVAAGSAALFVQQYARRPQARLP